MNLHLKNSPKEEILRAIVNIIKQSETFFIAGHIKPDGDAIGSGLALSSVLRRLGKKVVHCSIDPIPADMLFMKGARNIKVTNKIKTNFDCAIILECIDFERMGNIISPSQAKNIINIDHHLAHKNFGKVNYVVPNSSSVAELIYDVFLALKIEPNKIEAENLYIGIVTDTGRFQQLNTTANSHFVTAQLLQYGVKSNKICKKLFLTTHINKLKLYGFALSNIQTDLNEKFVYIKLTKDMFKKSQAVDTDTDGIISFCISVPNAVVGCVFKEIDNKTTKVSLRSIERFNLLDLISQFNGGGHKNAAGCTINADIDTAAKQLINAFKDKLSAK
ncbi:MAG: bifunctional oligoribonuclease/PAP phosphatase NrnA [Endomicrobiia bacterium]|nr:bifunctional oligoribonuclease/PAP phosphatase NrnA [Endomicrobiaceae bacterium]MDD3052898.1 bifunctional oligoribonuclease/PAP phosphatase NrnA [Endomicrobiaceae bacterium]MDD3922120.1 bifunctional oligoribonuclease/PAP phosphatase NrnA [Endomicrobiaceae bacterium]